MTFSEALKLIKDNKRLMRLGWNEKGMFIYLVPGDAIAGSLDYINMRTALGYNIPWLASQTDLLSNDWMESK